MKYFFAIMFVFLLAFCKTKKKGNDDTTKRNKESKSTGNKTSTKTKSPHRKSELEVAQAKWPGTTENDLREGKTIFDTKCTRCHAAKEIVTRSEENWRMNIDKMAPRAKLSAEEKDKLTRYVLSYLESHTSKD